MPSFNLNDHVKIKLGPKGLDIHRKRHDYLFKRYSKAFPYKEPEVDGYGYSTFQLWEVMQIFGPHIYTGCEPPFETEIRFA